MKKISYINKRISKRKPASQVTLTPGAEETFPTSSTGGIGRGYVMLGESVNPPTLKREEEENILFNEPGELKQNPNYKDLLDLLTDMGDALDDDGLHSEADFIDFLITKTAEVNNLDYSNLFKNLLIKIVKSDLSNNQDVIKKIVKHYNNIIIKNINQNIDKKESEKIAYNEAVGMANKYVTGIY